MCRCCCLLLFELLARPAGAGCAADAAAGSIAQRFVDHKASNSQGSDTDVTVTEGSALKVLLAVETCLGEEGEEGSTGVGAELQVPLTGVREWVGQSAQQLSAAGYDCNSILQHLKVTEAAQKAVWVCRIRADLQKQQSHCHSSCGHWAECAVALQCRCSATTMVAAV